MYDDSFRKRYGTAPVAISSTEGEHFTSPHIHNEIEMLYIMSGRSQVRIANQTYDAQTGDVLFVNPMEVHAIFPESTGPYRHQCICFDEALIADRNLARNIRTGGCTLPHRMDSHQEKTTQMASLFRQLYDAVEENAPSLLFDVAAAVSMMFSLLIRNGLCNGPAGDDKQPEFCAKITSYIAAHYAEPITSQQAAQSLFYTQSYFCRTFRTNFGVSFSEYLNMYRLLIAREKLAAEPRKIAVIAAECGFYNANYFTRCFRNTFGKTPLQYRKSQSSAKKRTIPADSDA
jgi:AraC-like DNA-binding protein